MVLSMRQFTVRLDEKLDTQFGKIKEDLGLKNDNEVVRSLIREEYKRRFPKQFEEERSSTQ
jgi:metal-responsive CopG/Arc/MetJ family transcriptional regulator